MAWYVIYDDTTGRLQTHAYQDVSPPSVSPPLTYQELAGPVVGAEMWDEVTKTYVVRPPKIFEDRVEDFLVKPNMQIIVGSLNASRLQTLRDSLAELLGRERFRGQDEPPDIPA